ncbi:unnamed protein product [Didymodactylos carnosus]|uniref:Uncharacterized protein n=1 Tax=Didymodactylos carnosus TaxID=1234261 RepID=A0A813R543_9BILA|nr:unnamed protein product [Didymodactylos carnosus]CAF0853931.1 unnamed protein product [Didymodactylos carnosus]CAF3561220.1 unnamed protein product [Didymodactylos carnosus]CAF3639017.1 unnamed protein product [Didymodactylos carnosus]
MALSKSAALNLVKQFRIQELQALLDYAHLSHSGHKRDLQERVKKYIMLSYSPQVVLKIQQINLNRISSTKEVIQTSRQQQQMFNKSQQQNQRININSQCYSSSSPQILPTHCSFTSSSTYPNEIEFLPLPFYDKIKTIICSNINVEQMNLSPIRFTLNAEEIEQLHPSSISHTPSEMRLFLRFCVTNSFDQQIDVLPPYLYAACNGQSAIQQTVTKTMGQQAHHPTFPSDITDLIIAKPNTINIIDLMWMQSPTNMQLKNLPKSYTLAIHLMKKVPLNALYENILKREPYVFQNPFQTRQQTNDSDIELDEEDVICTTTCKVSLLCPITQTIMQMPSKSIHCSHLTCFDLKNFLIMNEKRMTWNCPLCKKACPYETLAVDKRLENIIKSVPMNCSTVEMDPSRHQNGDDYMIPHFNYIIDTIKQERFDAIMPNTKREKNDINYFEILDHSTTSSPRKTTNSNNTNNFPAESNVIDQVIVLSSDDEEEKTNQNEVNNNYIQQNGNSELDDAVEYTRADSNEPFEMHNNNNNNNNPLAALNSHRDSNSSHVSIFPSEENCGSWEQLPPSQQQTSSSMSQVLLSTVVQRNKMISQKESIASTKKNPSRKYSPSSSSRSSSSSPVSSASSTSSSDDPSFRFNGSVQSPLLSSRQLPKRKARIISTSTSSSSTRNDSSSETNTKHKRLKISRKKSPSSISTISSSSSTSSSRRNYKKRRLQKNVSQKSTQEEPEIIVLSD